MYETSFVFPSCAWWVRIFA